MYKLLTMLTYMASSISNSGISGTGRTPPLPLFFLKQLSGFGLLFHYYYYSFFSLVRQINILLAGAGAGRTPLLFMYYFVFL